MISVPKLTVAAGELRSHQLILSRLRQALQAREFTLTVVFPTISLLNYIQDELLNQPGVDGIGGVRLLLFEGFIEESGGRLGITGRQPSLLERNLLITRSFRQLEAEGKLTRLNRAPFGASYRQAILQGIAEWKRSGLTPGIFTEWAVGKGEQEQQLALLYQSYQDLLIQSGYSEADLTLAEFQSKRAQPESGRTTPVLLYGFTDLTPLQSLFLQTLTAWFDFEIILDPTRVGVFQELSARYFNISGAPDAGTVDAREATPVHDSASKDGSSVNCLTRLQDRLWTGAPENIPLAPGDHSVTLLQAAGLSRLATGIAREVSALLKTNPELGWDDFLILAPDPAGLLQAAAPFFAEYRLDLAEPEAGVTEFPWVSRLSNGLTAAANDWQWPDLESWIRQLYLGAAQTGDRLLLMISERYGAVSGRERWLKLAQSDSFRQYFAESGCDLEPLLQGIGRLAAIPAHASLKKYLGAVKAWLAGCGHEPAMTAAAEPSGDCRETERRRLLNYRAVQLLSRGCDEWLAFLARTPEMEMELAVADFHLLFNDYLLGRTGLKVEPPAAVRPGIRVLPPREARGLRARFVFITGLEQGVFPRTYINDWKVDLRGRFELRERGIELETGAHYLLQERMAFYWALQSATERLYLAYQDQDAGGQPLNHSTFLDEVLEWVPELATRRQCYPLAPGLPETLGECHSAFEAGCYWAHFLGQDPARLPEAERVQCEALLNSESHRQLVAQILKYKRRRMGPPVPLFPGPDAQQFIAKRYGSDYTFAITALEDYRSCPYRFFMKQVLKVRPPVKPEFTPSGLDLGSLYHQILEAFCDNYRGAGLLPGDFAGYERRLMECFENYYREWQEAAANDLVKLLLLLQENQIRRTLRRWLNSELQWAAEAGRSYQIEYLEFAFGLAKGDYDAASVAKPFQLEQGFDKVRLWGKIDRIDVDADGRFIVYDYKSGRGPSVKGIRQKDYLQLPVYMMALEQLVFGAGSAAGGSYLGLAAPSRSRSGVWRRDQISPAGAGLMDEAEWQNWLTEVQTVIIDSARAIRQGEFYLVGKECLPYCEYRDVCRRAEWEVDRADGLSVESATS